MDIKIQSIHFDATEKLQSFIEKKLEKVGKACDDARKAEVVLKVLKPETAKNKQTSIKLPLKGTELFVEKICDTFEESGPLRGLFASSSREIQRKTEGEIKKSLKSFLHIRNYV